MNLNKSPRLDGLKKPARELSEPLAMIFDKSLQEVIIPEDWRDAQVTPLFKKGEKANPSNYRPVSLTSIVFLYALVIPFGKFVFVTQRTF